MNYWISSIIFFQLVSFLALVSLKVFKLWHRTNLPLQFINAKNDCSQKKKKLIALCKGNLFLSQIFFQIAFRDADTAVLLILQIPSGGLAAHVSDPAL